MDFLIIGDIHGCFYTLENLISNYWVKEKQQLLFLGDYVNKGNYSLAVLAFLIELRQNYGDQVILLKGNNEVLFEEKFRKKDSNFKGKKFKKIGLDFISTLDFLNHLPHFWENEYFFASHAGVAKKRKAEITENDVDLLFNRKPLKNIGKIQFLGHIVVDEPYFDKKANAWYLDTGAGYGEKLSFAHVDNQGNVLSFESIKTDKRDFG